MTDSAHKPQVSPRIRPVRWGFLGAGNIAQVLAGATRYADGTELYAVAARDRVRAEALEPQRVHGSYAALIADPEVEAVYIALSNDAHRPWALSALAAGKSVLCEKPLALSAAEVDEMARAAEQADRLLVEASWYRWHPRVQLAQRLLARGEIGEVREVSAGFAFRGVPLDNYRLVKERGGGALYDVGCYAVSAALWAVGQGLPDRVDASGRLGPTGVDLAVTAELTWSSGARAEVRAGIDEPDRQWLAITGRDGRLVLRDAPFTASFGLATELVVEDSAGAPRVIDVPPADPYRTMVEQVSAVLRGQPGWVLPLQESRDVAAVLDACFASLEAASPVSVGA